MAGHVWYVLLFELYHSCSAFSLQKGVVSHYKKSITDREQTHCTTLAGLCTTVEHLPKYYTENSKQFHKDQEPRTMTCAVLKSKEYCSASKMCARGSVLEYLQIHFNTNATTMKGVVSYVWGQAELLKLSTAYRCGCITSSCTLVRDFLSSIKLFYSK